jgi:type I restriction enzyme S subunit
MKEGWVLKTLGDVCISKSSNVAQNKLADEDGDFPIYGASGLIKKVSFYHRDKPYLSIVKDGSGFGRVTKLEAFTSVIGTLQYILPKEDVDIDYLYYALMSVDFKRYVAGAAIPHIYFKDYKNEPFLWVPLPEQQRIVSIIDKAFEAIDQAIANTQKNLENAKELFESYLNSVFEEYTNTSEIKAFEEVLEIKSGRNQTEVEDPIGKYPILGSAGKVMGYANQYLCDEGTTIIGRKGTINSPMYIEEKFWNVDTAFGLQAGPLLAKKFLYYFCLSYDFSKEDKGSGRPSLVKSDLLKIKIPLPKLREQNKKVSQIDSLSQISCKLETQYLQKLRDLEELKKSILNKAFAGEL